MSSNDPVSGGFAPFYRKVRYAPLIILFIFAGIYGLSFSLNRIGVTAGIPFLAYMFWQAIGAGLIALTLHSVLARRGLRVDWVSLRAYLIMAVIGMIVPFTIYAFVAPKLPAGIVGLTLALIPILTYLFALSMRLEVFMAIRLLGIVLGFAGVLMIVLPETSLPSRDMVGWVLVAMAAPVCLAGMSVSIVRLRPPDMSSLELTAGILVTSALLMVPIAAVTDTWWWFSAPFDEGDGALLGIALIQMLMWFGVIELIRLSGPVFLTMVDNLSTLSGVGWGILLFAEVHSLWIWGALGLLLPAVFLVNFTATAVRQKGTLI